MSDSFVTLWTVAHQDPLPMEFSRQEYWSGLLFHSPADLPNPGTEPRSPTLYADSLTSKPPEKLSYIYDWYDLSHRIYYIWNGNPDKGPGTKFR